MTWNGGKLQELQALRGIAAMVVALGHFVCVLPDFDSSGGKPLKLLPLLLKWTPLHILTNGAASVALFFVLSGFVLSVQRSRETTANEGIGYTSFLIRRFFRIYPAYWFAIILAAILAVNLNHSSDTALTDWYRDASWSEALTRRTLYDHILLLTNHPTWNLDNVVWSLAVEVRISLIFPALYLICSQNVIAALGTCIFFIFAGALSQSVAALSTACAFAPQFIMGIVLMNNWDGAIAILSRQKQHIRLLIALCSLLIGYWIRLPAGRGYWASECNYLLQGIGACGLILSSVAVPEISHVLTRKALSRLGEISYSFYLWHVIVLVALIKLLYGTLPLPIIFFITVAATIYISSLTFRLLEQPLTRLGNKIARSQYERTNSSIPVSVDADRRREL